MSTLEERRRHIASLMDSNSGRPIQELVQTRERLKGAESQRLRTFFTSNCMEPWRDLDSYGNLLFRGDLLGIQDDFERRKGRASSSVNPASVAIDQLFQLRWGPTHVPIYNCLLLSSLIQPQRREMILDVVRWLISVGVPVDGTDLSGTTALAHALSTKPGYDPEFAQLLLDAGGNINARNRYGGTCAHEFCLVRVPSPTTVSRACDVLRFFLSHGGNLNIKDNDGVAPRLVLTRASGLSDLLEIAQQEDARRKRVDGCTFCGCAADSQSSTQLMKCGKCKKAKYCAPPKCCQRGDWARHKAARVHSMRKGGRQPFRFEQGVEMLAQFLRTEETNEYYS